jgi:hypothetical protein
MTWRSEYIKPLFDNIAQLNLRGYYLVNWQKAPFQELHDHGKFIVVVAKATL